MRRLHSSNSRGKRPCVWRAAIFHLKPKNKRPYLRRWHAGRGTFVQTSPGAEYHHIHSYQMGWENGDTAAFVHKFGGLLEKKMIYPLSPLMR